MSAAPILIMAGGTGGHVYPALAIANAFRAAAQPVVWLGTRRGLEARVVTEAQIPMEWVSIEGVRGKGIVTWLLAPFRLAFAVYQCVRIVRRVRPRLVLGMGGFVSGPGGIAAWLSRCPLVIHEQNAVAGLTNRVLSRIASRTLQAFDGAFGDRADAVTVGNPVRDEICALPDPAVRYGSRSGALRLLVIGGSQGSLTLNRIVPAALTQLNGSLHHEVRHQAGSRTIEAAQDAYATAGIAAEVTPFIDDMAEALGWADFVICRAGALTVAEISTAGLPAILVPFPAAVDDHQTANARQLVTAGAALLVPESRLTPASLADAIRALGTDREPLLERARAARALGEHDAVTAVMDQCRLLFAPERLNEVRHD